MRLAWGMIIALGLSFPPSGRTSPQQEAPPATQDVPANQPPPEAEKAASAAPREEPGNQSKVEPTTTEPKTEPRIELKKHAAPSAKSRRRRAGKHASSPAPEGAPRKIVVREGGAAEPPAQIVTGMAPEEANRQREAAEQLLNSTGETLRRVPPGPLDAQRQETVSQIQNYMEESRAALKEGDISRAHTLAEKASLLAQDIVKH